MSVGFEVSGVFKRGWWPFGKRTVTGQAIEAAVRKHSSGWLAQALTVWHDEGRVDIQLHPTGEALHFHLNGESVMAETQTSSVGPGYHAYVIRLLDALERDLGVNWQWQGEEGCADESEYAVHRDFAALQLEMLTWLHHLALSVLKNTETGGLLCWSPDAPTPVESGWALSPLGRWDRDFFERVAATEPAGLHWAGEAFFPWWNEAPDALFHRQAAIALLNTDCTWKPPQDDAERLVLTRIDRALQASRALDPKLALPDEDWRAVQSYLAGEPFPPPPTPIGFRKGNMRWRFFDWTITLPGHLTQAIDDGVMVLYDDVHTVRLTSFVADSPDAIAKSVAQLVDNARARGQDIVDAADPTRAAAVLFHVDEADGGYFQWMGSRGGPRGWLLVSLCYHEAADRSWAEAIWQGIEGHSRKAA